VIIGSDSGEPKQGNANKKISWVQQPFIVNQFAEKEKLWRKKQKHNPVSGSPGAPERTSSDRKNLGSISHQDWV